MKVIVRVSEVQIQLTGVTLTNRQLRDLVKLAGAIAETLPTPIIEAESTGAPIGFSAYIERAPEQASENFYTDDEE
jgi:hypothetical protein